MRSLRLLNIALKLLLALSLTTPLSACEQKNAEMQTEESVHMLETDTDTVNYSRSGYVEQTTPDIDLCDSVSLDMSVFTDVEAMRAYRAVLLNEEELYATASRDYMTFAEFTRHYAEPMLITDEMAYCFGFVDFDNDGGFELVVSLFRGIDYDSFILLRYHEGLVYCYHFLIRTLQKPRADGIVSVHLYREDSEVLGIGRLKFNSIEYIEIGYPPYVYVPITYVLAVPRLSDGRENGVRPVAVYHFVNQQPATEVEYQIALFINLVKHHQVDWYRYTPDDVHIIFEKY